MQGDGCIREVQPHNTGSTRHCFTLQTVDKVIPVTGNEVYDVKFTCFFSG